MIELIDQWVFLSLIPPMAGLRGQSRSTPATAGLWLEVCPGRGGEFGLIFPLKKSGQETYFSAISVSSSDPVMAGERAREAYELLCKEYVTIFPKQST